MMVQSISKARLRFIALFLIEFCAFSVQAQTDSLSFPASWTGDWNGVLHIYAGKGEVQSVDMTLIVAPMDTSKEGRYAFGLIYGGKEKDWRSYELVPLDPANGYWKIDEKNTIAMESYYFGGKLICWFVVEGNRILCTYEKTGENELVFEVMAGKETAVSTTGKSTSQGEDIPEVKTYPVSAFQRAILKRK